MEGEINTSNLTASINIWINNIHYSLLSKQPDTSSITQSSKKVSTSIISKDWPALYGQLSSEIQNTMTESQFDDYMTSNTNKNIIAADLNEQGQINNLSGNTYYTKPITLTVQNTDGTTSIFHSNLFFAWENDVWKLLSTDTPRE